MREPRTLTSDDLEQYPIWEEMGAEGGAYEGQLRPRPDLAIAADTESETNLFVGATTFSFPRRPPFLTPFPALNRTLLAERLGHVRFPDEHEA